MQEDAWVTDKGNAKLAKARSSKIASLFVQAGWIVKYEFREREGEEPYEYILEWPNDSEPIRPELPQR